MDVVFGLYADGGAWPEHGGGRAGALGSPVLGPKGLLEVVEVALGLSQPPVASAVRIASWWRALSAAGPGRFFSASLEADGWTTARTLLDWRDALVEAGWTPAGEWPRGRIGDLAEVELLAGDMPEGAADRLRRAVMGIGPAVTGSLRRIRLIDPRHLLPRGSAALLDALEQAGVAVEEIVPTPSAPASSALGRMQRWMVSGRSPGDAADGSVTLAAALSSLLAADVAGRWIAGGGDTLAIVAQDDGTQLLDLGLAGAGQPRTGRSARSSHRGVLQILLLAFRTCWTPFDPHALMDLLVFPHAPVPWRAASRLSAALEAAPGRGSAEWAAAWRLVGTDELAAEPDPRDSVRVADRLRRWRDWVEPRLWDPVQGILLGEAVDICDRIAAWSETRHADDGDDLHLATAALARDVRAALVALDLDHVPRTLVERIVTEVLEAGERDPLAMAESARFRSVAHPGAIWGAVDDLVWWNFSATRDGAAREPWSQAERALLLGRDCALDAPSREARALGAAWDRAVLHCRKRLLLLSSGLEAHDPESRHPQAHRLSTALRGLADHVRLEEALASGWLVLAGEDLELEAIAPTAVPRQRSVWPTPQDFAERVRGRRESATSLEHLLSCQFMWALGHVADLRRGQSRAIPDEHRQLGNLAHALAREIFAPGPPPKPPAAAARAAELLEGTVDRIAATLRHPSRATELALARSRLPVSMAALAESLEANHLVVEATERRFSAEFGQALSVRGAVDLVARDRAGDVVVVDLKWTRAPGPRVDEIAHGNAVQLATYGAALTGGRRYRAGYYLLDQRQFLTPLGSGLAGRGVEDVRSLSATWAAVAESWASWRDAAAGGVLVASGIQGAQVARPSTPAVVLEVRCDRCDYRTLCRVGRLR